MSSPSTSMLRRLEAFSDGVLAVAITLLVLNLKSTAGAGAGSLAHQLWTQWPSFAAYGVSFLLIGTIWVNHHALFALVARADRVLMFDNLLLLMFVTTIPFTTSTFATFLRSGGSDSRIAVLLYGASMTGMAIGFTLILARVVRHDMLIEPVFSGSGRRMIVRFGLGTLIYPVTALVSLAWPPLMLIAYLGLAVYDMFEQTPVVTGDQGRTHSIERDDDSAENISTRDISTRDTSTRDINPQGS